MSHSKKTTSNRTLSIILLIIICFCMVCGLAGCSKPEPGLNDDRSTNHKYDFVAYLDANIYGANGYGFLDIKPKDLSVSDFKSEAEYIAVKTAIDNLSLYINPDKPDQTSNLVANKENGLKNGDIITLSIKSNFDSSKLNIDMNLEPYKFQVKNLPKPKKLDIFDNSSVDFVGLKDGTGDIYAIKIKDGAVPNNLLDKIDYSATANGNDQLQAGKTIISVTGTLHNSNNSSDEDEVENDSTAQDFTNISLATYLGMQGYVSETTGEKVVREIATPINFTTQTAQSLQTQLKQVLQTDDKHFISLGNIQQRNDLDDDAKYDYVVTYYSDDVNTNDNEEETTGYACMAANVKMADTKYAGASVLALSSSGSKATLESCSTGFDNYDVKYTFGNTKISPTPTPSSTPEATTETETQDEPVVVD